MNKNSQNFLKESGFNKLTDVQKKVIPSILEGQNLIVSAPTGTGKTLSFALPVMEYLKSTEEGLSESPRALILSPVRELGHQTFQVCKKISHHHKLRVRELLSGVIKKGQRVGQGDILISTPQKCNQLVKKGILNLENLEWLILDEADQLLDPGFQKELDSVFSKMGENCKVGLFTATAPALMDQFAAENFDNKKFTKVNLQGTHQVKRNIETYNIQCGNKDKTEMLRSFFTTAKGKGIVFVNTKKRAEDVYKYISEQYPNKSFFCLHGDRSGTDRLKAIKEFREKKSAVMICSDILARGMDIEGVAWVVNYDLPKTPLYYLHRVGRTGRMKQTGQVYNLLTNYHGEQFLIQKINQAVKKQTELNIDSISYLDAMVKAKKDQKVKAKRVAAAAGSGKKPKKEIKLVNKRTPRYKRKKK